jgi:formate dehydrogenase beta subunit
VQEQHAPAAEAEERVESARGGDVKEAEALRPDRRWPNDPYGEPSEHYGVLRRVVAGEISHEDIIAQLKDSGLRGMGGACGSRSSPPPAATSSARSPP